MDKRKDIYDRIQTFEVSCAPDKAGDDIQGILNIMADLVDELRRIEAANIAAFQDNARE